MNAYVIYDTPEHNLNLLQWGHFSSPDAFLALKIGDKTFAFVSELEYGRCKTTSSFFEVHLLSPIRAILKEKFTSLSYWAALFKYLKEKFLVDSFVIPNDFPSKIYAEISFYVPVKFDPEFFNTQRAVKTAKEVKEITLACQLAASTINYAKSILQSCIVKNNTLHLDNEVLTAEQLRTLMELFCMQNGGIAEGTIVACGQDAVNPHCQGFGPLRANELIVIDFFPRLKSSHYYGDMTRTFIVGKSNSEQEKLYQCVLQCQRELILRVKPGISVKSLMEFAVQFFENSGYGLKKSENGCEGFIHSVGHGLGLDLHEYPSVSYNDTILQAGMVITIEPGLYFKSIGGVRIEDDVLVTENGCEVLSKYDYNLIL